MSLVGQQVRQYKVVSQLGQGGMGEVYEAHDQTLQRKVALKAIRAGRGLDPVARERFLREARILSQLDHPGICRIHDYITVDGGDFLVLELIEGTTLTAAHDRLDRAGRMRVAREIAAVLAAAHAEDVIHRDLKPDNVMIMPDGHVKVLDFGLARSTGDPNALGPLDPAPEPADDPGTTMALGGTDPGATADTSATGNFDATMAMETPLPTPPAGPSSANTTLPGAVLGTPAFMSPEQARGDHVGPASDLYSYGLILHWLFADGYAYSQIRDVVRLLDDVKEGATLPLAGGGLDPHLVRLVEQLKSRSRAARPTAAATVDRLDWILDKPRRRNRRLVVAFALVLLAAAGLKYTTDLQRERSIAEENRAQAEDLIDFMLGDLRDKLTPVGRLDVLNDVGDKALEYYAARRESGLNDDETFQLSKAVMQIGEVRLTQGDMESARRAFLEAEAATRDLLARDPDRTDWLVQLGAIHFWIGNVDYSSGHDDAAGRRFEDYLVVANRLVELEPDEPDWQLEVGYALTNLAALSDERGDPDGALDYLDRSIAIKRELGRSRPDDMEMVRSLANSLSWAGRIRTNTGDYLGALEALGESADCHRRVRESDPRDTINLEGLSSNHHLMAIVLEILDRRDEARDHFQRDFELIGELAALDPENTDWANSLATSSTTFARFHLREGDLKAAEDLLSEAAKVLDGLPDRGGDLEVWNLNHLQLQYARAYHATVAGDDAGAMAILDRTISAARKTGQLQGQQEADRYLGYLLILRGEHMLRRGLADGARDDFEKAAAHIGTDPEEIREGRKLFAYARMQAGLGRKPEAGRAIARLEEMGFARTDFTDFVASFTEAAN